MTRTLGPSFLLSLTLSATLLACSCSSGQPEATTQVNPEATGEASGTLQAPTPPELSEGTDYAIFAGGCFWCSESDFEHVEGVVGAVSGYTGGTFDNPTYEDVGHHRTDHLEGVMVIYEPARVSYEQLVRMFFRTIDPTQSNGQFCDRGEQYRSAVFVRNAEERTLAEAAKAQAGEQLGEAIDTRVLSESRFWNAEEYHQDYWKKNASRYQRYRSGCGRDRRTEELWGEEAGTH